MNNKISIIFYNVYSINKGFIDDISRLLSINKDIDFYFKNESIEKILDISEKNNTLESVKNNILNLPNIIWQFINNNANKYDYILFLDSNCKYIINNLEEYIKNHLKIIDHFYIIVDNLADYVFKNNYIFNLPYYEIMLKLKNNLEIKLLTNSNFGSIFINLKNFKKISNYLDLFNPTKNIYRIYYLDKIILELFKKKQQPIIKSIAINNAINYNNIDFKDMFYTTSIEKETFKIALYHTFKSNITTEKQLLIQELDKVKKDILDSNNLQDVIIPFFNNIE